MWRSARGEAELNNSRLLPRARPSALHIEFCISPVGAVLVCRSFVCREIVSAHPTCSYICQCMWGWKKNKFRLTGGPGGPWGPLGPSKPRGPYLETERGRSEWAWERSCTCEGKCWIIKHILLNHVPPLRRWRRTPTSQTSLRINCSVSEGEAPSRFLCVFFLLLLQRSPKLRLSNTSLNIYGFLNNHPTPRRPPPPFQQPLLCNTLPCSVRTDAAHPSGQNEPQRRMKLGSPWVSFFLPVGNFTCQAEGGRLLSRTASISHLQAHSCALYCCLRTRAKH